MSSQVQALIHFPKIPLLTQTVQHGCGVILLRSQYSEPTRDVLIPGDPGQPKQHSRSPSQENKALQLPYPKLHSNKIHSSNVRTSGDGRFVLIMVSHFNSLILICEIGSKQKQVLDEQTGPPGDICHCAHQARTHHLDKVHRASLPVSSAVSFRENVKSKWLEWLFPRPQS